MSRVLVLSDTHIWDENDPLYHRVIRWLKEVPQGGDVVVLAGDIFDLFVGPKRVFLERYSQFFDALGEVEARGVQLHYIEGNHDFLLKGAFGGLSHLQLHDYSVELELSGKRFLIAHGDQADPSDRGYRALRWLFRSIWMKIFVRLSPNSFLDWFGKMLSRKSRASHPRTFEDLPSERQAQIRALYRDYAHRYLKQGYDYVVLGHCHDLDGETFSEGQYLNSGYPRKHGKYVSWTSGQEEMSWLDLK